MRKFKLGTKIGFAIGCLLALGILAMFLLASDRQSCIQHPEFLLAVVLGLPCSYLAMLVSHSLSGGSPDGGPVWGGMTLILLALIANWTIIGRAIHGIIDLWRPRPASRPPPSLPRYRGVSTWRDELR